MKSKTGGMVQPGPIAELYVTPGGTLYPIDADRNIIWEHYGDAAPMLPDALKAAPMGTRLRGFTVELVELARDELDGVAVIRTTTDPELLEIVQEDT